MNEPEDNLETHEHHTADSGSRLVPHPNEGHVRPDPELRALIEELKRTKHEAAAKRRVKERDAPDAA
jgi:hypothetical protein